MATKTKTTKYIPTDTTEGYVYAPKAYMKTKIYLQLLPLPDSPKGTEWVSPKHYEWFYPNSDIDANGFPESYLQSHPDFWELKEEKRWKPEDAEEYFWVASDGEAEKNIWVDAIMDNERYWSFNCFKTKEEAERVAKLTRELWKKENEKYNT